MRDQYSEVCLLNDHIFLTGNISITDEGKNYIKGLRKRNPSKWGNNPNKKKAKMAKTMIVSPIPLNCPYLHKSSIQNFLFPSMRWWQERPLNNTPWKTRWTTSYKLSDCCSLVSIAMWNPRESERSWRYRACGISINPSYGWLILIS